LEKGRIEKMAEVAAELLRKGSDRNNYGKEKHFPSKERRRKRSNRSRMVLDFSKKQMSPTSAPRIRKRRTEAT